MIISQSPFRARGVEIDEDQVDGRIKKGARIDTSASDAGWEGKSDSECGDVCGVGGDEVVKPLEPRDVGEPSKRVDRQGSWYERVKPQYGWVPV